MGRLRPERGPLCVSEAPRCCRRLVIRLDVFVSPIFDQATAVQLSARMVFGIYIKTTAPSTNFPRVLVHYHYHEPISGTTCDLVNKRTNFAMFIEQGLLKTPRNIVFHITRSGATLPGVDEFYRSIGVATPNRSELLPRQANILFHEMRMGAATDLCHRARALQNGATLNVFTDQNSNLFDFVMFLNDSTRGPFVPPDAKGAAHNVPLWLSVYFNAFNKSKTIAAVGHMSCELDVHVASNSVMFKWQPYITHVHKSYLGTCAVFGTSQMQKVQAIRDGEVGVITTLLEHGYSLGSIWPLIPEFTNDHRSRLVHPMRAMYDMVLCSSSQSTLQTRGRFR